MNINSKVNLWGSLGGGASSMQYIPYSNATGWYYQPSTKETYMFVYGGGAEFVLSKNFALGVGYKSNSGLHCNFSYFLNFSK